MVNFFQIHIIAAKGGEVLIGVMMSVFAEKVDLQNVCCCKIMINYQIFYIFSIHIPPTVASIFTQIKLQTISMDSLEVDLVTLAYLYNLLT